MVLVNIILMGFGNVGKAFVRLIYQKDKSCERRYGLRLNLAAVLNSRGGVLFPEGAAGRNHLLDRNGAVDMRESPFWKTGRSLEEALEALQTGVFVECTPSDVKTGRPAIQFIRQAIDKGWHVVTANKGPLVVDLAGLRQSADKKGVSLGISGATAAALPTLDVALHSLAGTEIQCIEGILNGTSNYILTRMKEGVDYSTALEEAQEKGIAEPDPAQDVEGWDTAAKILIITNSVFEAAYTLSQVHVEGILNIPPELQAEARKKDEALKLIGRFDNRSGVPRLETKLSLITPIHPLYHVDGTQKGITFSTDTMGSVTVTGGKSDPRGAAAALLKDIINIVNR